MAQEPTNIIARYPLRVYTPIPDLQYNEEPFRDVLEIPEHLNVDVMAQKTLSPVTFQASEPHESLRTVPWIKPSAKIGDDDLERGVYSFNNGVWKSCIPEFEEAITSIEEAEAMREYVEETIFPDVVRYKSEAKTSADGSKSQDAVSVVKRNNANKHYVWAKQTASCSPWMFGAEDAVIAPHSGVFDFSNSGHANVSFVTELYPPGKPYAVRNAWYQNGVPQDRFLAYNHPWARLGAGFNATKIPALQWTPSPHGLRPPPKDVLSDELSYRMPFDAWQAYRQKYLDYAANNNLPEIDYPSYTVPNDEMAGWYNWCETYGYIGKPFINIFPYDERHLRNPDEGAGYFYVPPSPTVEDYVFHENYSNIAVQTLYISKISFGKGARYEIDTSPSSDENLVGAQVFGFRVWFTNWRVTSTDPLNGIIDDKSRTIRFMWMAFGTRKEPPTFESWNNNP